MKYLKVFKSSIIGFIRGCLSHHNGWSKPNDPMVSFDDALKFAINFSKQDISKITNNYLDEIYEKTKKDEI